MNIVLILSVIIAQSLAATIPPAATTREPIEHEFFGFYFDPAANMIGIKYYPKCYFYTLTDSERAEIHTRDGRRKLERKLIDIVDHGGRTFTQMTRDELHAISGNLHDFCIKSKYTVWKMD